jgi:uncharacterized protein (TIGR01777 family)
MTATTLIPSKLNGAISRPLRMVLVGGSGHVGKLLARHFHQQRHDVCVLARTTFSAPWQVVAWNGVRIGEWVKALDGADVVINLAGRSVDCRYNARNSAEILESRIRSTRLVGEAIQTLSTPPSVWLNASTATIYRHATDRPMDEETGELGGTESGVPDGWRFSIEVATRWEETFFAANTPNTRKVALRSAMTMSPDRGGVFDALLRLVRFGLGGRLGSGKQYVSWIHETDFVRAVEFLIANSTIDGVVNVASPNPVTNDEFLKTLREAWGIRMGLPATEWMLEVGAFLLRTETELILKSRRVIPRRLRREGFTFVFPEWRKAAMDLVRQWREKSERKADWA